MANKVTVSQRRAEVLDELLRGRSHTQIQELIQDKYGSSAKTVERDITHAYQTITVDFAHEAEQIITKHIAMYYKLYQDCESIGDANGAAKMLERIEKLKGIYKPEVQTAIQVNNLDMSNRSTEDLIKIINAGK